METLFRFGQIREAHREISDIQPIDLTTDSPFQQSIAALGPAANRKTQVRNLAIEFVKTDDYLGNKLNDPVLRRLEAVHNLLDNLRTANAIQRQAVHGALVNVLDDGAEEFLAEEAVQDGVRNLRDTIVAIKLVPGEHKRPIRLLADYLRAFEFVARFERDDNYPSSKSHIFGAQRRTLKLPEAVLSARPIPERPPQPPSIVDQMQGLANRYQMLNNAIKELTAVRPHDYLITQQEPLDARMPPEALRPTAVFQKEFELRQRTLESVFNSSALTLLQGTDGEGKIAGALSAIANAGEGSQLNTIGTAKPGLSLGAGARIAISGRPAFIPVELGLSGMRLKPAVAEKLSPQTQEAVAGLQLKLTEPIPETVNTLLLERKKTHEAAQALIQPVAQKTYRRIGTALVAITTTPNPGLYSLNPYLLLNQLPGYLPILIGTVPTTHADIKPAGVMDLLIVKQQLKGYEAAEVSHIENIMIGELRDRIHRRRLETETFTLKETETETTTENSLETTDRFEIRRESQEALQEQTGVRGSLSVSGSYGPTVRFQASGEASWSRRTEQSASAASEMAREVVQKASEKVTERILRVESRRVTREIEDIDQHTFDNKDGDEHVSGVYQWVSKVYEAQVFNYGERTLYDLMIPEPGAFLLEAFQRRRTAALELEQPAKFDLKPSQLDEDNYQTYVVLYGATDVKPPPQPFVTEAYDFNTGGEDKDQEFTNSTRIKIPDGYKAVRATMGSVVAVWDDWSVDVILGQRSHRFASGASWVWRTDLDEETGAVPMAMTTDRVGDVSIAVEVICQSTDRAIELWQAETHGKLVEAYRARLSEYEAKLAELQAEAPAEIESGPSAHNRALMNDEVKKACISILTEQNFDLFNAIDTGGFGLPQINFSETQDEGAYVRFFEQAFEWENMAWIPYSYFWGRKSGWLDRVVIQDDDQDFEAFLKAGYVRVVLPVRPGFEPAVDHFRLFGEPWQGGALPSISDENYLPIAEELAERLDRPGPEKPEGAPWEVRVPTSLVYLRRQGDLPRWNKQEDGSWTPAE